MSEQPETMLEYHIRKLSRKIVLCTAFLCAALYASAAGILSQTNPQMAAAFIIGAVGFVIVSHGMMNEGRVRNALNTLSRSDHSSLERPDERPKEVPTDD